jgi:hypothetical protein
MGAFGSILGGLLTVGSLAVGFFNVWTFTDGYLPLLWFVLFGVLGGVALGYLNSSKARTQSKYKNEYTAYVGMLIAAIVFLGLYYLMWGIDKIEAKLDTVDLTAEQVVFTAMGGAIAGLIGVGLTIANAMTEDTRRY